MYDSGILWHALAYSGIINASLITADGAYHCPVGSIWPFLTMPEFNKPTFGSRDANTTAPPKVHSNTYKLTKVDVTKVVIEQGWKADDDLQAVLTNTLVEGLPQPVVIQNFSGLRKVKLPKGKRRRDYGDLLNSYSIVRKAKEDLRNGKKIKGRRSSKRKGEKSGKAEREERRRKRKEKREERRERRKERREERRKKRNKSGKWVWVD